METQSEEHAKRYAYSTSSHKLMTIAYYSIILTFHYKLRVYRIRTTSYSIIIAVCVCTCVFHTIFVFHADSPNYPEYLTENGLSEDLLTQLLSDDCDLLWEIPNTCSLSTFYSFLHPFLKTWDKTKYCTKTFIGHFYMKIDPCLKERNFRADNAYRFVERISNVSRIEHVPTCTTEHETKSNDVGVDSSPFDSCEPPHFDGCPIYTTWSTDLREHAKNTTVLSNPTYIPKNVDRRENRKKLKIQSLQDKLKEKDVELRRLQCALKKKDVVTSTLQDKVENVASKLEYASRTIDETERERELLQKKVHKTQVAFDF